MFFFFLGGVRQQVRDILQRDVAACLRCGYPSNLVNYDNVLELFFIPVWRWPAKYPALHCSNCGFLVPNSHFHPLPPASHKTPPSRASCWSCARPLEASFRFCPDCGARQDL